MIKIEDIVRDYYEIVPEVINCKTVEQIQELAKKYTVEINYDDLSIKELKDMSEIETIRIENYGVLDYIYFIDWQKGNPTVLFDVWGDDESECIIEDTNIYKVTKELEEYNTKHDYEIRFNLNPMIMHVTAKDVVDAEKKFDEWFESVDKATLREMFVQSLTDVIDSRIVDIIEVKY